MMIGRKLMLALYLCAGLMSESHAQDTARTHSDSDLDDLLNTQPESMETVPTAPPTPVAQPQTGATGPEPDVEILPTIPVAAAQVETEAAPSASHRRGLSAIEEIVVTAQKREESLSEVPIAVSAFSGKDLAALGVTDTRDLGNLVPGFSYSDSGYTVPIYSLRGVGFNESSQTASATVGLYVDEQNLAFPVFSKGANLDLERVEVLKGPQGTLYGRNTTGGAVNYIANKPTEIFEAGLTGTYARFQTRDIETFVSGPLTDSLRARFAYRLIQSDEGWQHSLTRPDDRLGRLDKQSARLMLDWQASDTITTALTLSGWTDDSEPQAPQVIGFQPQNPVTGSLIGDSALAPEVRNHPLVPFDTEDTQVADWSPLFPWHLNETFLMAASRTDWNLSENTTGTLLASYTKFKNDHALIPQSGLSEINTERELIVDSSAYALEARFGGQLTDTVDWLAGAFLSHDEVYEYQSIFIDTNSAAFVTPGLVDVFGVVNDLGLLEALGLAPLPSISSLVGSPVSDRVDTFGDQTADTYAFFANLNWQFTETLKLNLGARYTSEVREFQGCSVDSPSSSRGIGFAATFTGIALTRLATNPGSPLPTQFAQSGGCFTLDPQTNNAGLYTGKLDEDNVSGRVALDWKPADDLLFYGSFSRGFKSGSFPIFASSDQAQYQPITQEQLDAFELGAKSAFLDRRLRANFAAFYYDYKNKQLVGRIVDAVFGPLQKLVNAPTSTVQGLELELQGQPLSGLFLGASAIYIETEVKEFVGLDQSGDLVNLAGKPFNFSPKIEYTLIADYVFPLNQRLDIGFGADYSFTDATNSVLTGDPEFAIDDYALLNLRLSVASTSGAWKVTAFGRNVTDEYYSNGVFNTGDTIGRYAGQPFTYGITLDLRVGG